MDAATLSPAASDAEKAAYYARLAMAAANRASGAAGAGLGAGAGSQPATPPRLPGYSSPVGSPVAPTIAQQRGMYNASLAQAASSPTPAQRQLQEHWAAAQAQLHQQQQAQWDQQQMRYAAAVAAAGSPAASAPTVGHPSQRALAVAAASMAGNGGRAPSPIGIPMPVRPGPDGAYGAGAIIGTPTASRSASPLHRIGGASPSHGSPTNGGGTPSNTGAKHEVEVLRMKLQRANERIEEKDRRLQQALQDQDALAQKVLGKTTDAQGNALQDIYSARGAQVESLTQQLRVRSVFAVHVSPCACCALLVIAVCCVASTVPVHVPVHVPGPGVVFAHGVKRVRLTHHCRCVLLSLPGCTR